MPNSHAPLIERFEASYIPEPNSGCWIWIASTDVDKDGYQRGKLNVNRKSMSATRTSYLMFKGDPTGLCVCHRCDTTLCVNPDHLWLGTHQENMADKARKGRGRSILKADDIPQIRQMLREGASQSSVAKAYGVNPNTICGLYRGRNWRHIP
ncbi:HNH endonuclease [Mesorhizobium caraganae]|uniref:HNH endonuclease n=1 Tax=Mesorhizobium caraganae TaxID=483206 RepID=UPI001782BF09|nr:HNH endonuclease [Mesorhizobium caraganae]